MRFLGREKEVNEGAAVAPGGAEMFKGATRRTSAPRGTLKMHFKKHRKKTRRQGCEEADAGVFKMRMRST